MSTYADLIERLQAMAAHIDSTSYGEDLIVDAELDREAADAISRLEREKAAILKVRDGYKSQMKFCDIEALGYFREFVRRIDEAISRTQEQTA